MTDLYRTTVDGPRLIGSRCGACDTVTFSSQGSCPKCSSQDTAELELEPRGTLWTWTVQTFPPKPPYMGGENFAPYGVGYVELPGQVRVEARLTESDPDKLEIGMPMRLTLVPVPGNESESTYAFEPDVEEPASD